MFSIPPYQPRIAQKYGFVRRARDCYLYTQRGKRLTDLFQDGGRAILGWNAGAGGTAFKNVFNRGVHGIFDSEETHRLAKATAQLLPGFPFSALVPADDASLPTGAVQWRPWLGTEGGGTAAAVWFWPPFPLAGNRVILASKAPLEEPIRTASIVQPCILAGISRAIYDLIAEIPRRGEEGWKQYDRALGSCWTRCGPYLFPRMAQGEYGDFAARCLEAGLVISPHYGIPSIVPWGANKGDFKEYICRIFN
ncbi:MAG: hypothetical protein LBS64_05190 [Spirochaetaceae bacterium]|jgi:hypothetical protein|nr:hypothetical protein [Spirochaetaceae bacterium]